MRVVRGVAGAILCLAIGAGVAATPSRAASFDGKWIADIPAQGGCVNTGTMTIVVAGGMISGEVHNAPRIAPITGKIDADGNATFTALGRYPGTMKFNGDRFEATWNNGNCDRHAEGGRAPDDNAVAAAATQRKQYQDTYADLVRRAKAGEKIDFTLLRADAVYAENWEFYDNKVNGLIDQANAAAKGKDCDTVMDKTDQILKYDFIVDSAHALRADCLRDKGDRDGARIEENIADGLVHSLMDSGDGDAEKSAYVVSTYREEMDVLANRHIQIKARQTEVRGSNGHFYDLIQGISIRNGVYAKAVYFDIGSFVAGRESRRAAIDTAAATIH